MIKVERIIDRIRKLIRHEQSARKIGSLKEAAAFAEKIQKLQIEHKISAEQISLVDEGKLKPSCQEVYTTRDDSPCRRSSSWEDRALLNIVAKAYFCRAITVSGTNVILVLGLETDRAVAIEMFWFLRSTMKRLASVEETARRLAGRSTRRFRPSFYQGFLVALSKRYDAMRLQADQIPGTALVLRRSDEAVEELLAKIKTGERTPQRRGRINSHAYFAGLRHGRAVSLATKVLS